jgi:CheY-like chemotaxis protein
VALAILVVDDEEKNRRSEVSLLTSLEVLAVGVGSAEEAMAALEAQEFHALLTDVNLANVVGDQSGVQLAKDARSLYPKMGIVGYTGVVANLSRKSRNAFDAYFRRGDDAPEALAAGAIRVATQGGIPDGRYPFLPSGLTVRRVEESEAAGEDEPPDAVLIIEPAASRSILAQEIVVDAYERNGLLDLAIPDWPQLLGYGPTFDEALSDLLEVMVLLRVELEGDEVDSLGEDLQRLREFLMVTVKLPDSES